MTSVVRFEEWQEPTGTTAATVDGSGNVSFSGTITQGGVLMPTASALSKNGKGIVAYAEQATTFSSTSTSYVDITNMSLTWDAEPNRYYRVYAYFQNIYANADSTHSFELVDQNNVNYGYSNFWTLAYSYNTGFIERTMTGLSGTVTRKVRYRLVFGSPTLVNLYAASTYPLFMYAEDLGEI